MLQFGVVVLKNNLIDLLAFHFVLARERIAYSFVSTLAENDVPYLCRCRADRSKPANKIPVIITRLNRKEDSHLS